MPKILRTLDAIMVVLAGRVLAASYRRFGYAPIATQFTIQIGLSILGGIAGCYLVSRWSLPDTLTGFLLIMGTAVMIRITSSSWPYKRLWTRDMHDRSVLMAQVRYREGRAERLLSLVAAVSCLGGMVARIIHADVTGTVVFMGLAMLASSSVVNGYMRSAPPPQPVAPDDVAGRRQA